MDGANHPQTVFPYTLELTGLEFPEALPDDRCQLRVVVDVRLTLDGHADQVSLVLPSADDSWNAAKGSDLRLDAAGKASVNFDQKVCAWDKSKRLTGSSIAALRVSVYDTHGDGFWDHVDEGARLVLEAAEEEYLGEKIGAGSNDSKGRLLFRRDAAGSAGEMTISGPGKKKDLGDYTVKLRIEREIG